MPAGQMLDIGCGTGHDAIWCATRGWHVTDIDAVSTALRQAQRNAKRAGAKVRFIHADMARVAPAAIGTGRHRPPSSPTCCTWPRAPRSAGRAKPEATGPATQPTWHATVITSPDEYLRQQAPRRGIRHGW
jgi:SAM-dependent methyltransferase